MVTLLTQKVLSDDESRLMSKMNANLSKRAKVDERLSSYYEGQQRLEQIGIAVPPELRRFETVVNWPRVVVDEVEHRLDIKALFLPGEEVASRGLREAWEANNLDSESPLLHKETMIFGRGFVTVGTNEDDATHPLITVEPPRQMVCLVEQRRRRMLAAMRSYRDEDGSRLRTLYLPDETIWLRSDRRGWAVEDRDPHGLGRPPVVMFLNRRRLGDWWGVSEMADAIPLTDSAARSLTNLQIAQEGLAVPGRYIFGVDPKKLVDKDGKQIPVWEAYYTALMAHADKDVKAGQWDAADLSNFHDTINHYGNLVASTSGLPSRYFVSSTVNPAAEGAIRADESRLVKNVERKGVDWGDGWGWVAGLYERFRTGEWIEGNRVRTEWHDAGTPTIAQKTDSIQKLTGGQSILSREGAWDELGWSESRKDQERERFRKELEGLEDPYLAAAASKDSTPTPLDADEIKKRSDAMGQLIRAGVKNDEAARIVGLPGVAFTPGLQPITLRSSDEV